MADHLDGVDQAAETDGFGSFLDGVAFAGSEGVRIVVVLTRLRGEEFIEPLAGEDEVEFLLLDEVSGFLVDPVSLGCV
jgi:hypothetical protein